MPRRQKPYKKDAISVAFMIDQLQAKVGVEIEELGGGALAAARSVTEHNLHRPGLALAGYVELFTYQRVQILGNTETRYLASLEPEARRDAFERLIAFSLPCLILTGGNDLDAELVDLAVEAGIPVYRTPQPSTDFMSRLRGFLTDQFALQQSVHATLVDVYGVGLLLTGASGIGKSEVALDLVERGHRLVADDVVIASRTEDSVLMGAGTDLVQHFMEIRGLGLVDVRAMFGIRAIRFQKRIEVVVQMELWHEGAEYTRIGMVEDHTELLGVALPQVRVPVTPGKNITVICEVIAMNHLLRNYGYDPAEVFKERLAQRIQQKKSAVPQRGVEYFEHDSE